MHFKIKEWSLELTTLGGWSTETENPRECKPNLVISLNLCLFIKYLHMYRFLIFDDESIKKSHTDDCIIYK